MMAKYACMMDGVKLAMQDGWCACFSDLCSEQNILAVSTGLVEHYLCML